MIDETALRRFIHDSFDLPIRVAVSNEPADPSRLSPGEAALLDRMTARVRRESWLRGRAALKRILADLGQDDDTSALSFPHPGLSLSHSGDWAVAVGIRDRSVRGVGVDLELRPPPRPETMRKFLGPAERAWVEGLEDAARGPARLRLWTVKEAAFKADPGNAGASLKDYAVAPPDAERGALRRGGIGPRLFRYASLAVAEGYLTVAVLTAVDRKLPPK